MPFQPPRLLRSVALTALLAVAAVTLTWAAIEGDCDASNGSCKRSEDSEAVESSTPLPAQDVLAGLQQEELQSLGTFQVSVLFGFCCFMVVWIAFTLKWAVDGSLPARLALCGLLPEAYAAITVSAVKHLLRLKSGSTPVVMLRNAVTPDGALQLAEALRLHGKRADLQVLELPYNPQMDVAGLRAIVEVILQEELALEELDFSFNRQLGDAVLVAVEPLLERKASRLTHLKLVDCGLKTSSLATLTKAAPKLRLQTLHLSGNDFAGAGEAISELLEAPILEELHLTYCGLQLEDLEQIAEQLPYTSLKSLQLAGNGIKKKGLQALADNLPKCQVDELGLEVNELHASDLGCLGTAWVKRPFSRIQLHGNPMTQDEIASFIKTLRSMS